MPDLDQAQAAYEAAPENHAAKAEYAWAILGAAPLARAAEARKLAEEVIAAAPQHAIAQALLARTELRVRKEEEARQCLESAFDPAAPHFVIVGLLGRIYLEQKEYDKAAAVFEAGLKMYPREHGWTRALAVANLRRGHTEGLAALMETVAARDPDDASSREWLLANAASVQSWDEAVKWGIAAIHIDVQNPKTHQLLGEAYLELKQIPRARRHLEAALVIEPQNDDVRKLLERLPAE